MLFVKILKLRFNLFSGHFCLKQSSLMSGLCKNSKAGYAPAKLHGEVDQVVNVQNYYAWSVSSQVY